MPRFLLPLLFALPTVAVAADPKPLAAFDGGGSLSDGGGFSADGKHLIGFNGTTVRRYDLETGKELPLPKALRERICRGVRVDGDVWLMSLGRGREEIALDGHTARFVLFDFATEKITADWTAHTDKAGAVAYLPATDRLVTAGDFFRDNTARIWDRKTLKPLASFDLAKEMKWEPRDDKDWFEMRRMAASPSGNLLAFGFNKGMIQVRDLKAEKWYEVQADLRGAKDEDYKGQVQAVAFVGEKLLAVKWMRIQFRRPKLTTWDAVEVFDWKAGKSLYVVEGKGHLSDPAPSPDGKLLVVGWDDGTVRVLDAETGKEVNRFKADRKEVDGVLFREDGKRLATVGSEGGKVWDAAEVTRGKQ